MKNKELSEIKWGEIYMCDLGEEKGTVLGGIHPILVVQTNELHYSSPTVIVAVITPACKKRDILTHVSLETECGLHQPSVVALEQLRTIDKAKQLQSYVGKIENPETVMKINNGIRHLFQLEKRRKTIRTGYILSLCPHCRSEFFCVAENILRRVDPLQVEKRVCDKCQVGYGYDYLITKRTSLRKNGGVDYNV